MIPKTRLQWGLLVALFAGLIIFPGLGRREITGSDEGQRAVPGIEMLETGDWVIPRLNGETYLNKPPLLYWMTAGVYRVFGVNESAARLPCALAGVAFAVTVFLWASRFSALPTAALAGAISIANYMTLEKARECQLDLPMALFTLWAQWAWWTAAMRLHAGERGFARAALAGGLWLGLAHLLKFPVPILFVLAPLVGTALLMRRPRWLLRWPWWGAIALSLVPIALWALAVAAEVGVQKPLQTWLREGYTHVLRASRINSGPPWYYAERIAGCFFPWWLLIPVLLTRGFRGAQSARTLTFAWLWTGVVICFVLLSLNVAKETEYMIGSAAPLSILLAWAAEHVVARAAARRRALRLAVILGCLGLWLAGSWIVLAIEAKHINRRRSVRRAATAAVFEAQGGTPLVLYRLREPSVLFYLARRAEIIDDLDDLASRLSRQENTVILTKEKRLAEIASRFDTEVVAESAEKSGVVLVRRAAR
jgi:4-amino-4-deoxy-L-arabinose transferase-like glycosyltransferase